LLSIWLAGFLQEVIVGGYNNRCFCILSHPELQLTGSCVHRFALGRWQSSSQAPSHPSSLQLREKAQASRAVLFEMLSTGSTQV
jgi:hypothetical protein